MTIHRSSIKNKGNTAVAKHFNLLEHSDQLISLSIMDDTPKTSSNPIKLREAAWIGRLSTIIDGINERDETAQILNLHTMKCIMHFNHSNKCWPYMLHQTQDIKQETLSKYKRVIINQHLRQRLPNNS